MMLLAEPTPQDIIDKLSLAIPRAKNVTSHEFHEQMKHMYDWNGVAKRTVI
jgi:hypothetical protein